MLVQFQPGLFNLFHFMTLFNFYNNINQLNSFKLSISNQEFVFIYNIFKTLSFIQIYNFFKIIEIKLKLSKLCLSCLNIIFKLKINKKNFKFFFLINCINLLKKNLLKKNFLNFLNLFFSLNSISSSYKEVKFFNKKFLIKNFLVVGEVYKNYKGSIIPFNISKLSWFVRLGLKTEVN